MTKRALRLVFLAATVVLASVAAPAGAGAATTGPCLPEGTGPRCTFWFGKVKSVSDGDTVRAYLGSREVNVRVTGIQAMEQSVYSSYPSRRRGECHSLEATARFEALVRRGGGRIRLAAQNRDAMAGKRLRRSVAVPIDGKWRDVGTALVSEGHALWLPNGGEDAWNGTYSTVAQRAALAGRRLYDRNYCGAGPGGIGQVSMSLEPNAPGNDRENVNGEYADIRNNGARPLSLAGWRFRDSALRWYTLPSRASVPAGRSIRVRMGVGRSTASVFFWGQDSPPFENDGDGGYLFDRQGDLRAWDIYPCRVGC